MNRDLYNVLRIVIWTTLFVVVAVLFFRLLPYLIVIGVIVWVVKKIVKFFKERKENQQKVHQEVHYESKKSDEFNIENKDVIDVDYTEVK